MYYASKIKKNKITMPMLYYCTKEIKYYTGPWSNLINSKLMISHINDQ